MTKRTRINWRRWLRALHRDAGYLAVGLTFVYALSGLAVNHIADWDPNFTQIERSFDFDANQAREAAAGKEGQERAQAIARSVLFQLERAEREPVDVFALDPQQVDITLEDTTLYVDLASATVREEGQKERFLLRAANWLHLNRGKKAWTFIADGYAIFLVFLATSGMFMIRGRQGLWGRGLVLVSLGVAIPVLYVTLSGGP